MFQNPDTMHNNITSFLFVVHPPRFTEHLLFHFTALSQLSLHRAWLLSLCFEHPFPKKLIILIISFPPFFSWNRA